MPSIARDIRFGGRSLRKHLGLSIVAVFALGSWSGSIAERHFKGTDPGPVVLDEVLGMLITLFMVWYSRRTKFEAF